MNTGGRAKQRKKNKRITKEKGTKEKRKRGFGDRNGKKYPTKKRRKERKQEKSRI